MIKKKILAVMFILCMAVILIPISAFCQTNQPVVGIVAPPNGATLSGNQVEITVGFASDENHPLGKIRVFLDGISVTERIFETPSVNGATSFKWDTTRTPNGRHQIDVQGFSSNGDYLGMSTCVVMVLNKPADYAAPKVAVTDPKEGDIVSGVKTVSITASDESGTDPMVSVFIDNTFRSVSNSKPYTYDWDTTKHENGPHVITVKATDEANNISETKPVKVIVRNVTVSSTDSGSDAPVISVAVVDNSIKTTATPDANKTGKSDESSRTADPASVAKAADVKPVNKVQTSSAPQVKTVAPKQVSATPTATVKPTVVEVKSPVVVKTPVAGQEKPVQTVAKKEPVKVTIKEPVVKTQTVAVAPKVEVKPVASAIKTEPVKTAVKIDTTPKTQVSKSADPKVVVKIAAPAKTVNVAKADVPAKVNVKPSNNVKIAKNDKPVKTSVVVAKAQDQKIEIANVSDKISDKAYVIQSGDNISKIASIFGVSQNAIVALNNIENPEMIIPGEKLILPEDAKMVRIRSVVDEVGGTIEWNAKSKTVRAICAQSELKVKIGSDKAVLNNEQIKMEKKAKIHAGRTIVPKSIMKDTLSK